MSNAIAATGILLLYGDGATPTEAFTAVAELVALKPPARSRNEIDVTNHNEGEEAKILGIRRKGQVTGTVNYIPSNATHAQMLADYEANTKRNWRIAYPDDDNTTDTFPARVQLFDVPEQGVDAALQAQFALTIDGTITTESDT